MIKELNDWSLQLDPLMVLLGIMEDVVASRYLKLFLFFALYCRELPRWMQPTSPTLTCWVSAVNAVLPLCKLTYESRKTVPRSLIKYGPPGSMLMGRLR